MLFYGLAMKDRPKSPRRFDLFVNIQITLKDKSLDTFDKAQIAWVKTRFARPGIAAYTEEKE
jgi:hypothetical protein